MFNLGADLLHLQPRDELERLRRASVFLPRPAGDSLNEQYAWTQLHALNEADIGAAPAEARESAAASIGVPLATHWTRILHHDLYCANDAAAEEACGTGRAPAPGGVQRHGISRMFGRRVAWLADSLFAWLAV